MKARFFIYMMVVLGIIGCVADKEEGHMNLTINTIERDNSAKLTGGIYRITNNNRLIGEYSTENGAITIVTLPLGSYVIEEVAPPFGYIGDQKQMVFEVDKSQNKVVTFTYSRDAASQFLPQKIDVSFYDNYKKTVMNNYSAVRIGEYYWVNSNFTHHIDWGAEFENSHPITQELLNRYLKRARLDVSQYQLPNIKEFEKYYGRYYSRPSLNYMLKYGEIHERKSGVKLAGWKYPSPEDFRQLCAMCPFNTVWDAPHTNLNERDVRFALSVRQGDNPMAFEINDPNGGGYETYWFAPNQVSNMYGFNLMPGGARLNGPAQICNGYGPSSGCYLDGKSGDLYGLFYVAGFAAINPNQSFTGVGIHDYMETSGIESYHLLNARWCKPLSDNELEYRLYIDASRTDIKKLAIDERAPAGYTELPRGYIRGFYVQYILDNPHPIATVADVVQYAKNVEDSCNF